MAPRPDRIGPYAITGVLGEGGMGVVLRGRHLELGVERAIKLMLRGDGKAAARFEREVTHLAAVRHDNVVRIHECGAHEQQPYFVMDLLDGRALDEVLKQGRPPLRQALRLAIGVCRGVDALHAAGVIHRDLKPANVMVTQDGRPVVVDVGLAVAPELDDRLTKTGALVGTVGYMAPEQVGKGQVSTATDVFALGLIVFELATGRPALDADSTMAEAISSILTTDRPLPGDVDPDLPQALDAVCRRATARRAADRYPRAGALADALDEVLRRPGPSRRAAARRRRALLGAGVATTVAALAAAGWLLARGGDGSREPPAAAAGAGAADLLRDLTRTADPAEVVRRADAWLAAHPDDADRPRVEARRRDARRRLGDVGLRALRERDRGTSAYLADAVAWLDAFGDHPEAGAVRTLARATARRVPLVTLGLGQVARFVPGSDGRRVLLAYHKVSTTLWDVSPRAALVREWPFGAYDVAPTPDGQAAWLMDGARVVRVRFDDTRVEDELTLRPRGGLLAIALSPDGTTLAVGDRGGVVTLVSTATRGVVGELPPLNTPAFSLDWSPRGDRLYVGNYGAFERDKAPQVYVADVAAREYRRSVLLVGTCHTVVTSPDGRLAAIGTGMGRIFLLDLQGDAASGGRSSGAPAPGGRSSGAPAPRVLVGEGRPGDDATGAEPAAARGAIGGLAFTPDGRSLLSASWRTRGPTGDLSTWDLATRTEVRERSLVDRGVAMFDLDLSPRGDRLLLACGDQPAEVWLRLEDD